MDRFRVDVPPFGKTPTQSLSAADLGILVDNRVREGYTVEYKGDFPSREKIAKGLAALANTNGGWFIVGVETDEDHAANSIVGFPRQEHRDPVGSVRSIARDRISPVPTVYPQVIALEGASADRAVLAVYVPPNQETPFLVNGVFYRRNHDSSDPIPETDRHAIDRLIDQGRAVRRAADHFASDVRLEGGGYYEQGWASIYIWPEPSGTIQPSISDLTSASLEQLKEESLYESRVYDSSVYRHFFDQAQTTNQSFILRQFREPAMNRGLKTLMLELFVDGRAKMHLPLEHMAWESRSVDSYPFHSSASLGAINMHRSLLGGSRDESPDFFDIYQLWRDVKYALSYYRNWIGSDREHAVLRLTLVLSNVASAIAFADSDTWARNVEKHGLPSVTSEHVRFPEEGQPGIELPWNAQGAEWRFVAGLIGLAFGLPPESFEPMLDEVEHPRR